MAKILADRVKEFSTTTGTGTLNLDGADTGFQSFVAGVGSGNTTEYAIVQGASWEVGTGTVTTGTPDTLSRDVVRDSSNGGSLVNFAAGAKEVFVTISAQDFERKISKIKVNQVAHGFSQGNVLYYNGAAWNLARADAEVSLATQVCDIIDVDNFFTVQVGQVQGLTGLVAGDWYYTSTSVAGAITNVKPTVGINNPVGFALDANTLQVEMLRAIQVSDITPIGSIKHGDLADLTLDQHIQYALANGTRGDFAPTVHTHTGVYEPVISPKNSAFNQNFGGTGVATDVSRTDHNHTGTYIGAADYASGTVGGTIKIRVTGSDAFITTDGTNP